MRFAKLIHREEVLQEAFKMIEKSQKEIIATMDLTEELRVPLPADYHQLIYSKARNGVQVRRLGFGKTKDFQIILSKSPKIKNFSFNYAGSMTNYQRMLLVDRKMAIFKVGEEIIFTNFEPLVLSLVKFFEIIYNQRKGGR